MELGKINSFRVNRKVDFGFYLIDPYDIEILLPKSEAPADLKEGDDVEAFVYKDSEDRIIATTLEPKIKVGEFKYLKIKQVNQIGAFADWGMIKDLLIPFREQAVNLQEGRSYVVSMFVDEKSKRLVGTTKIDKILEKHEKGLRDWEMVDVIAYKKTELGFKVVVNQVYEGLIYHSDIFGKFKLGDEAKAYVKKIREDGKLDISLQKPGFDGVVDRSQEIIDLLKASSDFIPYTDKSDPELIQSELKMSKKTFKKIVGSLYKQKVITIEENGIRLNQD